MAKQTRAEKKEKSDLVKRARDRFKRMAEADRDNRTKALEDLRFLNVPGEQWDKITRQERGDRPCYEFNKLRITAKRIINDMRANRPQGKVRAVEDGDKDTADVYDGLIRNIWNVSDGDTVIDYQAEYQVGGGYGGWRVNTDYSTDTAFDQDITVSGFKNPFCLYMDPAAADPMGRDARDWVLTERIANTEYEERWPDKEVVNFDDTEFDDEEEWQDDETTRICEYWWKEPDTKELWLTEDGRTIDPTQLSPGDEQQLKIKRKRTVQCHKIMMCIVSGDAILEKPTEWAGSMFPFVPIFGERMVIDGKVMWHGITRFAKDAQRSYNVARTAISETIAMAPQGKFWATPEQAQGHVEKWGEAHSKNFPFLLYNADAKTGGAAPQRMGGADVPVALMQESQIASDEIKAVTGIFDPSLGQQSNETSGKAITARQRQGEIATFNYMDNMAKGIRRTWEILIDLIPKIYDTERSVRILGVDLSEKYSKINQQVLDPGTGEMVTINDLSRGKYDVTVTVGPSFATQRQEATELYTQLGTAVPQLWQFAGDLIMKSMDLPYADKMAERMKLMLPPQVQQQESEGKPMPPEVQMAMQQADQAMQMAQQQSQLVQQAAQEVEQSKAESQKEQAKVQTLIQQLKTEEVRFEAKVQQEIAKLTVKEAGIAVKDAQSQAQDAQRGVETEKSTLTADASDAIKTIQDLAQQFAQFAAQQLQQIEQRTSVSQAPKRRQIRAKRVNGELVGSIDDMDEAGNVTNSRPVTVSRQNGEIVGQS